MKFKQLLTKSLLAAVCLLVGQSAWGVDVTTTIDFNSFVESSTPDITLGSDAISQSGTNALTVYQLTNNGTNFDRIALSHTNKSGVQKRWLFRNDGSTFQKGLCGNWNSKGTANDSYNLSILDLKEGDRITITWDEQSGKGAGPKFCSAGVVTSGTPATDNTAASTMASGTTYTMKATGNLDLYSTNNNLGIHTIVIVSTGTEEVTSPTLAITGASGYGRKVTITAGASNASNAVTTYYTTDGSEPTTSSPNYFTTASQVITVGENATEASTITVKALTVSSASAESSVTSQNVTVGTLVQLAAPTISMSSFASAGLVYNPVYSFTSDQSGVIGTPSVTYSYSFAGGASTAGTSYTASSSGKITVTVSADGYESNSTVLSIVGGNYAKTYSFDATKDVTVDTSTGTWESASNVGGVQWTFTSLDNCTYSLRADITLTGFMYARATTAQTKQGFYARLGSGSVGFSLTDGEYVVFGMRGETNSIANSGATSKSFGQYSNIRSIEIFTPATDVDIAILDCKQHETSAAFAKVVDAETFATADEVYAFHTAWQIENAVSDDITKVIFDAPVSDFSRWNKARSNSGEQYTNAPDNKYFDAWDSQVSDAKQKIYGLPAGNYSLKVATRASEDLSDKSKYNVWVSGGSANVSTLGNHDGNTGGELGNGWSWTIIPFTLDAKADVEIGFYSLPGEGSKLWAGADDWHLYKLPENVTKTISTAGWATFCSPYALDLANATGLTDAYIVTGGQNGVLTKSSVKGGTVPANTGLLLKGNEGTATIPVVATSETDVTGNILKGVTEATEIAAETGWVLMGSPKLGFYQNAAAFTVGANTAYILVSALPVPPASGAARASYLLFDDMTGISQVAGSKVKTNGVIYNLNGQRVSNPTKGIYIIDGVKVAIE